jgi:hypothetical protein
MASLYYTSSTTALARILHGLCTLLLAWLLPQCARLKDICNGRFLHIYKARTSGKVPSSPIHCLHCHSCLVKPCSAAMLMIQVHPARATIKGVVHMIPVKGIYTLMIRAHGDI